MDLSIIIITLNNKRLLEQCIRSIQQYTKDITYEIIVSDNGSSDGTQSLIRNGYKKISLIENRTNLGFSRANNQGLRAAKGRYALILNDDTYIRDDAFSKIIEYMENDPKLGICGPRLLNPDGSLQRQGSLLSYFKWRSDVPVETNLVIGACMFIRMSILRKIGYFDENLFFYNEDLDLCKSAKKAGFRVFYSPIASVYHYGGYSSKRSSNYPLVVEGFRGGLYFCKKHYGALAYHVYRALLLVFVAAVLPFSIFNRTKLKSYIKIIRAITGEHITSNIQPL